LTVRDSVIRNFSANGINFQSNASTPSQLFVSNTLLSDNSEDGIIMTSSGTGNVTSTLDRVAIQNNNGIGLAVAAHNPNINVTVSDSVIAGNGDGISSEGFHAGAIVMVRNSTIANNTGDALLTGGVGCPGVGSGIIMVSRSTIAGNGTGWVNDPCGAVTSYADNNIDGNTNVNTEPPSPLTYK
jgi:hypothetical protein